VESFWVVKLFDVFIDGGAGVGQISEGGAVGQFRFEGAPEGLHGGVVVAVAAAAHAGDEVCGLQEGLKGATGILDTLIGMEEEARAGGGPRQVARHPGRGSRGGYNRGTSRRFCG
jgi:hypothetical protein